jgi:hypothetical protein
LIVGAFLLSSCGKPARPWSGITARQLERLTEHREIGLAYLENDEFVRAAGEFEAIEKAQPRLVLGFVDRAVALMGMHSVPADAVREAKRGAELASGSTQAQLVLAEALRANGQLDDAQRVLEAALRGHPDDVRVLTGLIELGEVVKSPPDQIHAWVRHRAEVAPRNLMASLEWLQSETRRRDFRAAREALERVQPLLPPLPPEHSDYRTKLTRTVQTSDPTAPTAAAKLKNVLLPTPVYLASMQELGQTGSGLAALAVREWDVPPPAFPAPGLRSTVRWSDVTDASGLATIPASDVPPALGSVTPADAPDASTVPRVSPVLSALDLIIPGSPSPGRLPHSAGHWAAPIPPTTRISGSALLADLNNDFSLDLYVAGETGDRVFRNRWHETTPDASKRFAMEPGAGKDAPFASAASPPGQGPGVPLAADLDLDGDLDIVRPSSAAGQPGIRYLRNDGHFRFTDFTRQAGLFFPSQGARQVVAVDVDRHGEPDLFVVQSAGPCRLFLNRRQDRFVEASNAWGIQTAGGALCAATADFGHDGRYDLVVVGKAPHGSVLYHNEGNRFSISVLPGVDAAFAPRWVEALDYDNDGWIDLVVAGDGGVRLLHNDAGRFSDGGLVTDTPARWVKPLDYDADGDLDLLVGTTTGRLRLFRNEGGNALPWIDVELHGKPTADRGQANSSYGIGAEIECQTPWEHHKVLVKTPQTHIGLGRAQQPVNLRVTWTHSVSTDAIGPAGKTVIGFQEMTHNSCPFLYAWDGKQWRFSCDFNWKSPLGMVFARGKPVPFNQTRDWARIPGELLRPAGGYYRLSATEELHELNYLDFAELRCVDHPADTEVYVDERFRLGPEPEYRVYTARHPLLPRRARDAAGRDLLPALRSRDNVYTPVPPGPYRGVLQPHDLILDLGDVPDPHNVRLFLNGWIFPASTSTNVATGQDPAIRIIPPQLSVGDGHGGWKLIDRNVGLPCGKRKTIVLSLGDRFVGRDFRLKLTTTMEIRWDQAFYTSGETAAPFRDIALPVSLADLRERGFGTVYQEVPEGPYLFDYNRPHPRRWQPGFLPITGRYTKLGVCTELLTKPDDRYVITGPGDELQLGFDATRAPQLPAGWKRDFVFVTDGWTKDGEGNTTCGDTVEPLPFHGMKSYPPGPDEHPADVSGWSEWRRRWNTRMRGSHEAGSLSYLRAGRLPVAGRHIHGAGAVASDPRLAGLSRR